MYEFCSEDEEDTENIHPLSLHFGTTNSLGHMRPPNATVYREVGSTSARKACEIDLEDGDQVSVSSQNSDYSDFGDNQLSVVPPVSRCNLDSTNVINKDKYWIHESETESSSSASQNKARYSKMIGGKYRIIIILIIDSFFENSI